MPDDESIHEIAPQPQPQPQPQYEERAIRETLVDVIVAAGGVSGIAGGVAAVAGTIHHWGDNQPPQESPPEPPHIELPPGVSGDK